MSIRDRLRKHHAGSPCHDRISGKIRAVELLPAQRDKEIARLHLACVRRDAGKRVVSSHFPKQKPTARRRADLIPCHESH